MKRNGTAQALEGAKPLAWMLAVQMFGFFCMMTPPLLFPAIARDNGFNIELVGFVTTLSFLAATLGAVFGGEMCQRFGPVRTCQLHLCLSALAMGLLSFVDEKFVIVVSAVLIGAGYGWVNPATSEILASHTPAKLRGSTHSIKQSGVPLGAALAGLTIPLLATWYGWRVGVLLVALAALGLMAALQSVRREFDTSRKRVRTAISLSGLISPVRLALSHPRSRELAIAAMAYSALQNAFGGIIVTHLTSDLGVSLIAAGLVLTVAQSMGAIGRIFWGIVADWTRQPRRTIGLLGVAMSGAAIGIASFSQQWPTFSILAMSALFGVSAIGWNGIFISEVAHSAPDGQVASATGAWSIFAFGGGLLGPALFSVVLILTGSFAFGYYVLASLTLACACMFLSGGGAIPPVAKSSR